MKVRIYFTEEPASTNWTEIINLPTAIDIQDVIVDGESFYLKAKKEMFDELEKMINNKDRLRKDGTLFWAYLQEDFQEIKQRHLPTFANNKSDIIADTKKSDDFLYQKGKQNPQTNESPKDIMDTEPLNQITKCMTRFVRGY